MQDGSNKSFFPHGFHGHIYAEALMNRDCDYEEELADYFCHLYGDDWKLVRTYLDRITDAFDHKYMAGELSSDSEKGKYINPGHVQSLKKVESIAAEMRQIAQEHMLMPTRPQTVAWRIILRHTEFCERMAQIMMEKCIGHNEEALELFNQFKLDFGKYDFELERYFDFSLFAIAFNGIIKKEPNVEL